MAVVPNADIRRAEGVTGTRRQFEGAVPTGGRCQPEHMLLDLEVAGIGGGTGFPERSSEGDRERSSQGDPEGDPGLERSAEAFAAFDLRDPGPAEPDPPCKVSEGHSHGAAPMAHGRSKRA